MMNKIVFFNAGMQVGGVPRVISLWSKYFIEKGLEVEIISNIEGELFYDFGDVKYSVLGIDKFKQKSKLKALYKIYQFLKDRKDEVLIFNKGLYISYLFILKKLGLIDKSLKLVYFVHGGSSDFKSMYSNLVNYMINETFDNIIALHNDYENFEYKDKTLKRKIINTIFKNQWDNLKQKIVYIPNPVTFRSKKSVDYNQKVVLAVGRLDKIKGFDLLIKAWEKLANQYDDWRLRIVGSGEEEKNLKNLAKDIKNIEFIPAQKDIKKEYLSSSIYVMSSREEGMPMVVIEAMECGLPIVAFSNVGAKFLVKDNQNGLLCDVGDIKTLSKNIEKLIKDKNLREKLGKNSKEMVKQFYIENLAKNWNIILEKK